MNSAFLPNAVVDTANARKSAGSRVAETGKHGAGDRAMNGSTFPPTALAIEEEKNTSVIQLATNDCGG